MNALLNHLWQSTLFAVLVALLTIALRKNRAAVRHSLWLAASVKFLLPFSLLISIGNQIEWRPATPAATSLAIEQFAEPFTLAAVASLPSAPATPNRWPTILFIIWAVGFTITAAIWLRRWLSLRRAVRAATPLRLDLAIPVRSTLATRLEPGVFGIFRPVLLLPAGIADRLTPAQLQAILAHELAHVRRRDNLAAAIHMLVEALFWFHPLVWWIEHRMVEERECACDEAVLGATADSEAYASGILEVCKLYLESPLICVAGVTGSDLKRRIAGIMRNTAAHRLDPRRKLLLTTVAFAAIAGPVILGILSAPSLHAQATKLDKSITFDVASVKPNHSGRAGHDGFRISNGALTVENVSLKVLIEEAYGIQGPLIAGGPAWLGSDRFDVLAKGPSTANRQQVLMMLRSLLADRFQLDLRNETRQLPIYALTVAKNGPKLPKRGDADCEASPSESRGAFTMPCGHLARFWTPRGGALIGNRVSMAVLADALAGGVERPVVDRTSLAGTYDVDLHWTPEGYVPFARREAEGPSPADTAGPGPSIFTAVQEQLGLRLESRKDSVGILIVSRAERLSEN